MIFADQFRNQFMPSFLKIKVKFEHDLGKYNVMVHFEGKFILKLVSVHQEGIFIHPKSKNLLGQAEGLMTG